MTRTPRSLHQHPAITNIEKTSLTMATTPPPAVTATSRLPVDFIDVIDHHDAVDRLKLLNRGSGFTITIERTKHEKSALKQTRKVFLRCWKSRPYKSTSLGKRQSSTRSTECPWRACLTRADGGWKVEVKNMVHNHELDATSPVPKVKKRQIPKAPLRVMAALNNPYPLPGAQSAAGTPSSNPRGTHYAAQSMAGITAPIPFNAQQFPQPFIGFSQFQGTDQAPALNMPAFPSSAPGAPSLSTSQMQQGARPSPTDHAASSGPRRVRRNGYSVMSEIKASIFCAVPFILRPL